MDPVRIQKNSPASGETVGKPENKYRVEQEANLTLQLLARNGSCPNPKYQSVKWKNCRKTIK
jgi:hypothetical protein